MSSNEGTLYIFNPVTDLALGSGLCNYTPTPAAAALGRSLQMLPAWWAEPGARILSHDCEADALWCRRMAADFGFDVGVITPNQLQNHRFDYRPWGWDATLWRQLRALCVSADQLPAPECLKRWRELAHRRTTIALHRALGGALGRRLCPEPVELTTIDEVVAFARAHYRCFLKAPWSGSGHGIFRPDDVRCRTFVIWTKGTLARQGSVMAEVPLDGFFDFAMEFRCVDGRARFAGYSVFGNDAHSSFSYGLCAPQSVLERRLVAALGGEAPLLGQVRQALETVLGSLVAGSYNGFVGVDMLLWHDDEGNVRLDPCVEMNLRTTMGVATAALGERLVHPQSVGTFRVAYRKSNGDLRQVMDGLQAQRPVATATAGDGTTRLVSGVLPLTPVYPHSLYCAYVDARAEPHAT